MSNIVKPAAVLLVICVVAAGLLGYVNNITSAPIAAQEASAKAESIKAVLPDGEPGEEEAVNQGNITSVTPVEKDGQPIGYAVAINTKGFSAGLQLMFGVDTTGAITGLSVVNCSNETPGLGANASKPEFTEQFKGLSGKIAVTKDGGSVNAITGATITSRAVANAASEAVEYVTTNKLKGGAN